MTTTHLAETIAIAVAYISRGNTSLSELPTVLAASHSAVTALVSPPPVAEPVALVPAVPVKKSVTADYIVCLEDGKSLKMLKRHLQTAFGLTPEQYRAKWGLPANYPMVAPNYAEKRSTLAKAIGLGRKPVAPEPEVARKPVGRPRKVAR